MTDSFQDASTYQSAAPPLADALFFNFQPGFRWLMLGGAILFFGFMAFGLALPITDPAHTSPAIMILCVAFFGLFGALALQAFTIALDTVAVNSDGLWYLHRKGGRTFIAWSDVGSVSARDVGQRLVVTDLSGNKKIKLEYQLENFEKLRAFVLEHSAAARLRTPAVTIFHRNWVNRGLLLVGFVTTLFFTCLCIRQGQPKPAPIFLGFAVLALVGLMREPARVEITNEAIVVIYLGWNRTLPFDSITNIEFVDLHDRGNVRPTVIIERLSGKPLKLGGYREGSIALNDAISSAWRASRGGQAPPTAPMAPSEPAQPSPSLLTTFHGETGATLVPAVGLGFLLAPGFVYWELSRVSGGSHNAVSELIFMTFWAGACIYFLSIIPRRLTISSDSFTVEYYHRRRVVPYSSITNIELIEFRNARGTPIKIVKVERDNDAALRLAGFKEDAPTLYASLRDAWQRARAGRLAAAPEKGVRG